MRQSISALHLERAEEMVRTLAASVANARLYPKGHPRVQEAVRTFHTSVHMFFHAHKDWKWIRIHYADGTLSHRGVPLGQGDACAELTGCFEERECGGVVLRPDLDEESATLLLQWLLHRLAGPFPSDAKGVRILTGRAGAASAFEAEARESMLARVPELRVPLTVHEGAIEILDNLMCELRAGRNIDYGPVLNISERIATVAVDQDTQVLAGAQLPYDDEFTYNHSVNVCLIVTALIQPFLGDRDELSKIAEAALLHDVGKCRIPSEVLYKKGALTSEEFDLIRRHPEIGARLLLEHGDADPLTVQVAYCHHMRDDEFGYPNPVVPIGPGPIANLIAVVDMFEALTAVRPYKKSFSVPAALKILLTTQGMETKKPHVRLLFNRLTCYPPGCEVLLDSGERATVVQANAEALDRPVVRITTDADGDLLDEPKVLDLTSREGGKRRVAQVVLEPINLDYEPPKILHAESAPEEPSAD